MVATTCLWFIINRFKLLKTLSTVTQELLGIKIQNYLPQVLKNVLIQKNILIHKQQIYYGKDQLVLSVQWCCCARVKRCMLHTHRLSFHLGSFVQFYTSKFYFSSIKCAFYVLDSRMHQLWQKICMKKGFVLLKLLVILL